MAKTKIQHLAAESNGRKDYLALKEHYEGVGVLAFEIQQAESDLRSLYYTGEKKPHMWWEEFEKRLTAAYVTLDQAEGRTVFSQGQKLRTLLSKVAADFLSQIKSNLTIRMSQHPMTLTYMEALAAFRTAVNLKFLPTMSIGTRTTRRVREIGARGRGRGRFHGRHARGGRGGFGRGGRGRGRGPRKSLVGSKFITLKNGQRLEFHPAIYYTKEQISQFKQDDFHALREARRAHKEGNAPPNQVTIQSLQSQVQNLIQGFASIAENPSDEATRTTQVSQLTRGTMMGGRNEQAQRRAQDPRNILAIQTQRRVLKINLPSSSEPANPITATNDCDTAADTCCLGPNFVVMEYTNRVADVYGYNLIQGPTKNVPIVTGATAYDCPHTNTTFILLFNESLYYGTQLDHSLRRGWDKSRGKTSR